uniref:SHSP domain-containing protein n=1 Tax=Globodera rostochiensis TaxID=31243 RepID=A0A914HHJ7_GLORO
MFGNLTTKPIDAGPRPQPNSKDREKYIKDLTDAHYWDLCFSPIMMPLFVGSGIMTLFARKERVSVGRFRVPVPVLFGHGPTNTAKSRSIAAHCGPRSAILSSARDHVAQLTMSDSGELSYKVDGEQHEQKQGESVHRQFSRRVLIPEGIQKESIKCKLDWGRLCITGMKTTGYERRSIPIDVKKAIY